MVSSSPFAAVDVETALVAFRSAGSRDPDVLDARRATLLAAVGRLKLIGTGLMAVGFMAGFTPPGAWVGVPVLGLGWWLRLRGIRNAATIETAFSQFVRSPPAVGSGVGSPQVRDH